jgi:hypothetical protein
MFQNNQIQNFDENDYESSMPVTYAKCICNNPECSITHMSSFGIDALNRSCEFSKYFPDLLLTHVPMSYLVSDIYDIFNNYGGKIVSNITIVPGATYNTIVVHFNHSIPEDAYANLFCMRFELYKNPGKVVILPEIDNAIISVFDEAVWNSQPRFGLEYNFPLYSSFEDVLRDDPRTIHLYNYMGQLKPNYILTNDVMNIVDEYEEKMENDVFEIYRELYPENNDYVEKYLNTDMDWENAIRADVPLQLDSEIDHDDIDYEVHNDVVELAFDILDEDDNDDDLYEYCEIQKGVWHRRLRDENEDPDELHHRIANALTPEDRANAFWG